MIKVRFFYRKKFETEVGDEKRSRLDFAMYCVCVFFEGGGNNNFPKENVSVQKLNMSEENITLEFLHINGPA